MKVKDIDEDFQSRCDLVKAHSKRKKHIKSSKDILHDYYSKTDSEGVRRSYQLE